MGLSEFRICLIFKTYFSEDLPARRLGSIPYRNQNIPTKIKQIAVHLPAVMPYKKLPKSVYFHLSKGVLPSIFKTFYPRVFVISPTTSQSYQIKQTSNINFRNCCPTGVHVASKLEFNKFLKIRAMRHSENQILLFCKTLFTSNRSPPRWRKNIEFKVVTALKKLHFSHYRSLR